MTETVETLVKELADSSNMVYANGYINECRYCHVSWPVDFDKPVSGRTGEHYEECLYARARQVIAHQTLRHLLHCLYKPNGREHLIS